MTPGPAGTVTVLGATGKTGRAVAAAVRRLGLQVRGTSRTPSAGTGGGPGPIDGATPGLPSLTPVTADVVTGDGLEEAFAGADAAYLVMPNVHPDEVRAITHAARVALEAGVGRIVYHSVADPDDARMVHHVRKGRTERALRELDPTVVVLQPCAYQQNLLGAALSGTITVPYRLDVPFSLVDLEDVAQVAALALAGRVEPGSTHALGGPEDLSVTGLADQAAEVLGRPVEARRISLQEWRSGPGQDLPGQEATELAAMFEAYDQTGFTVDPDPLAALLGRRATRWTDLLRRSTETTEGVPR